MYTYLAGHVGKAGEQGAFRALMCGNVHWASGPLEQLEVNVQHPEYCHTMKASTKTNVYNVHLLLGRVGEFTTILSAMCECAAGYV